MGIMEEVCFTAMIPATLATPSTSPFFTFCSKTACKISSDTSIFPWATAVL